MSGRGLLSRIGTGERRPDVVSSVVAHLRDMLNTRQGESVTVPGYGLVDFQDIVHAMPEAIGTLQKAIRATVLEYEPRLRNVSVRHVPGEDPLTLRFEIVARLTDAARTVVRVQTELNAAGRFDVD